MTAVGNPACLLGGLGLLLTTAVVPFLSREGQLLPGVGREWLSLTALSLSGRFPGFWVLAVLALAWVGAGLLRQDHPHRPALWGGSVGSVLVLWLTWVAGVKPYAFGPGAMLALAICLLVLAYGLSQGGYIRADTFVAGSILALAFFVLLFILFPIFSVLRNSVMDAGGLRPGLLLETLGRYTALWRVVRNSLGLAIFVGVTSTLIGLAFALAAARSRSRLTILLRAFSLLPLITPPFVVGLAIILLFGLQGFVTSQLLGLKTRGIFGFPGLALAQTLSFAPVAFLVIASVVESVNPALEEASLTLRAGPWGTFRKVTLPLLRPGLANAFLLTIIESLADFGNPIVLGGEFEVLSTEIYFSIIGRFDQTLAATLGLILLSFSLTVFLLQRYWLGERSYVVVTGKPPSGKPMPLPRGLEIGLLAFCAAWCAFSLAIYLFVVYGGFVEIWGINDAFTLRHYRQLMRDGMDALQTTLILAGISAPLTATVGILLAYVVVRHRFPGRGALEFSSMLSFAVPGTVIGIGYIMAFNQSPFLLTGTATILVISFIFRNMPVGIRSGVAALAQIDQALEEASVTLRASFATTIRRVVLPLIRPAIISALVFSFVRSVTAISAVVFLVSAKWQLSTKVILDQAENGRYGLATAYSTVLILIMAAAIAFMYLVVGKRAAAGGLEGGGLA
ncbi:MAG: iron ABC transporter permease [candidate division NC10 bacterium]|nr:iron ABC transporter permease [candidate division NC10 bacterium]